MSTVHLTMLRTMAAAALAPATDDDPEIHIDYPDAVEPPAILLLWDDPWLTPTAFGPCLFDANLRALCVAARREPGPGVAKLEELAVFVVGRLQADSYSWPQVNAQAPRVFTIGGVDYLGANLVYRVPVTTEGGP